MIAISFIFSLNLLFALASTIIDDTASNQFFVTTPWVYTSTFVSTFSISLKPTMAHLNAISAATTIDVEGITSGVTTSISVVKGYRNGSNYFYNKDDKEHLFIQIGTKYDQVKILRINVNTGVNYQVGCTITYKTTLPVTNFGDSYLVLLLKTDDPIEIEAEYASQSDFAMMTLGEYKEDSYTNGTLTRTSTFNFNDLTFPMQTTMYLFQAGVYYSIVDKVYISIFNIWSYNYSPISQSLFYLCIEWKDLNAELKGTKLKVNSGAELTNIIGDDSLNPFFVFDTTLDVNSGFTLEVIKDTTTFRITIPSNTYDPQRTLTYTSSYPYEVSLYYSELTFSSIIPLKDATFELIQGSVTSIMTCTYMPTSTSVFLNKVSCEFDDAYGNLAEGEARYKIGIRQNPTGDLVYQEHAINVKFPDFNNAIFVIEVPNPVVVGDNEVILKRRCLYDTTRIKRVLLKGKNCYASEEFYYNFVSTGDDPKFTINPITKNLHFIVPYAENQMILLSQLYDDVTYKVFYAWNDVSFWGKNIATFECPIISDPTISVTCKINFCAWFPYQASELDTISMTGPTNSFTFSQGNGKYSSTADKVGSFTFTPNETGDFQINSVTIKVDSTFDVVYTGMDKPTISVGSSSSSISMDPVQFMDTSEIFYLSMTHVGDVQSFSLDNTPVETCEETADDPTKKICPVEIKSWALHYFTPKIYKNAIYTTPVEHLEVVVYEFNKECQNSNDDDNISLTLKTYTSGLFDGYEIYFNDANAVTVPIAQTAVREYSIELAKDKLTNGEVNKITFQKTNENDIVLKGEPLFYYVENSLTAIDGTGNFALGEDDKTLIFTFANDIDSIKKIQLTDVDPTVSEEEKYLEPKEECAKDLSLKTITCIYDLSEVYGVKYSISIISNCNDKEIVLVGNSDPTLDYVQPILPNFVISAGGVLQSATIGSFSITPPFRKSVTAVVLVKQDDLSEIEVTNFSTGGDKGSLSVEIPSGVMPGENNYKAKVTLDRREIETATAFTIIENYLSLSKTEIKFPNVPFQKFVLPLVKPVQSFQILSVEFESNPATFTLGPNQDTIDISFSSPTSFQNMSDHTITVTQLGQPTTSFTIKIFTQPTIVIPQTLFITDSPLDYVDPLITNPDGLVIDDIVDEATRTPSEPKYRINIDSTVTTTKNYEYKIETYGDYYFSIAGAITIVNANFETLFNKVFDCNLISNNEFTIDLTLISSAGGLSQTDISLKVFKEKDNSEITFTQQTPLFTYKCASLSPDIYRMELYYQSDSLPFYKKTFTLTSFNTARATFNLARNPFMIDFHDVLCDLGLPSLEVKDSSSLTVPLTCTYQYETISCTLASTGDVTSLNNHTTYQIFNSTYLIHRINLVECVGTALKIDTVDGLCVTNCKMNQDRVLDHNEECVERCPPYTGIIYGHCVDDLTILSETETSIDIDLDFETIQALIMKNFKDFASYGKTISGQGYKIQIYKVPSPIKDKACSSLDARNIAKDLAMDDLVVYKVDKYVENALLINVTFDIYTENQILIPKSNYKLSQYNISIPINQNAIDLTSAMKFAEIGVDIYNAKDDFFNDICFAYSTENDTDVILRDRRKDIFVNVSFCPEGSIYKGIDFDTNQVQCDVDPSASPSINDFAKEIFACNIAVVKCPQTFSQIAGSNIGLLCTIAFIITLIACTALFIVKDFFTLQRKINSYIINAPVQQEKPNANVDTYDAYLTDTCFIAKNEEYDKKVLGNPKEVDNFPFHKARKNDHRNFLQIFWVTYLDKEDITSICFPRNEFEMTSVNINYVMFGYCLDFVINALFYTDDQLSSRYQNGTLTFAQDLLRSLPANVISLIISSIFKSFVNFPTMLEMIIVEVRTSKIAFFMNNYYRKVVMNLILFHICLYVIVFFAFYYLTLFSTVYKSSQVSWFTGCLYSILTSIIVNFAVAVAITVLRVIGIKCNWKFVYNIQLYIKLMM